MYFISGYSYNYFRYTKTLPTGITEGERIIGTTPHTANGTIFYTFNQGPVKGLKLGASGYYTGKRNMGFNTVKSGTSRGVPVNVTDYGTFDFTAGYTIKKLSLLAKVSNITNEINYMVHENYSVNPIPPSMFSTTLAYKF
jgi:iron complex outermembrane receptor protein